MNDVAEHVFYPLNKDFLVRRHGTCDGHYWANWDLCNMAAVLSIGIFNDDQAKVDEIIEYFWNDKGQGSIQHVIPHLRQRLRRLRLARPRHPVLRTTAGLGPGLLRPPPAADTRRLPLPQLT
ncbi:hypothetical protein [Microlunatus sp. GCM10028923]|uniref:hypothetical protein n=1 Tax=Microlunatus sp. GCM10028923 TaxID=3273400 RepID=UPI00360C387A